MLMMTIVGRAGAGKCATQIEGIVLLDKALHKQLNTPSSWAQPFLLENRF